MTYKLALGDRAYSSWSLRAWLLFEKFDIPFHLKMVAFHSRNTAEQLAEFAPARTVPAVRFPDGTSIAESLAIAEELASRHPDAGLWPADPSARAVARALASEMHAGFFNLREDCPMNLRTGYNAFMPSEGVLADVARIEDIWGYALDQFGVNWLCGSYSIADAFFAPVAARIAGYGIPVGPQARAYVNRHLSDGAFRRWRAMGLAKGEVLQRYKRDFGEVTWPGPTPLSARPVTEGTPENEVCPYSGDPITDLLEIEGQVFGFCNSFCRDKTVNDPEAWPAFMAIFRA